jgi:uncharacterized PurR-regulated membrane protein YhhQ (DUF165 family)
MGFGANFHLLAGIILPYYLVRVLLSLVETPLVYLGVRMVRPKNAAAKQAVAEANA